MICYIKLYGTLNFNRALDKGRKPGMQRLQNICKNAFLPTSNLEVPNWSINRSYRQFLTV